MNDSTDIPQLDVTNIAQLFREIFYHLTGNNQSDKSPEQFSDHFFRQQERVSKLRQRADLLYKRYSRQNKSNPEVIEYHEIAYAFYRLIVEQGKHPEQVINLTANQVKQTILKARLSKF